MDNILSTTFLVSIFGFANCGKLSCNNGLMGPSEETLKALEVCKDPNIWGMEDGKKNPNCDHLCQAEFLEYLGPDGTLNQELYFKWIEADFGCEKNQLFAKQHITGCFDEFGSKIDLNDTTCEMVKKFDECAWSVMPDMKCHKT